MHPVDVDVVPALHNRNRLTTAFRVILAMPRVLLVGTPVSFALTASWRSDAHGGANFGAGTGALGVVAAVVALIAWFAIVFAWLSILFAGNYPAPLYHFGAGVLRWSTRVEAYLLLLHDDYPPFSLD
jgi:hypothetical protein